MNIPLLEIQNITKSFGDIKALKGVSLTINQGEIVSLLGVNGAGKTTLSTIIATLVAPTSGDIQYEGRSIYDDVNHFRRSIGYCQQKPNLNPMLSLRENLMFAGLLFGMSRQAAQARVEYLSAKLGLHEYLDRFSRELSGGYKQRFMIARSLMHSPKLVILDEPTVALDPDIRNKLWDLIRLLKDEGISILLTTHYLDEAEILSDRVVVLYKGSIKLIDTPKNLMSSFNKGRLEDVFLQIMQNEEEQ